MSDRLIYATYTNETDTLEATTAAREGGCEIIDVYTPYPIHGIDKAMGLKQSRLNWVCFICGLIGALVALWFQHWVASVDWALDVGGKPWNSLPSDLPVAFEMLVLCAGFGSVFALFAVSRLYPGKKPNIIAPEVSDNLFVLVINESHSKVSGSDLKQLLNQYQALKLEERLLEK
ncbi:hypothetical protein MNBD_PLANCTO02-2882 [hydrothermal vent metagenome]|uniref:Uncharacterized protein n=1 Tax=hydrothermal vent metagenome TaxID=652676 RepID=A0A3B1E4U1_9ZZZZ